MRHLLNMNIIFKNIIDLQMRLMEEALLRLNHPTSYNSKRCYR